MQSDFDLLISYSSKDKPIADALLAGLEANDIRCWIAPRNVQPGKTWGGSIMRSIRDTDVFLLILTEQSNLSTQVLNEVERAVGLQKPIICYRAENVVLSDDLELFLSSKHWVEAHDQPVSATIAMLTEAIRPLLSHHPTVSPIPDPDEATTPDEREEFLRNGKKTYLAREFGLAHDYFAEAAEAGSAEAMVYLGELYRKGEGIKRAPAKAKQFYQKAIDKGVMLGYWGLARMLDEADELPERATRYYEQAREAIAEKAVEEDPYCCYLYSLMYAEGKGVGKDKKRADRWLEKAVENGYKKEEPILPQKPVSLLQNTPVVNPPVAAEVTKPEPPLQTKPVVKPVAPTPVSTEPKGSVGGQESGKSRQTLIIVIVAVGVFIALIYGITNRNKRDTTESYNDDYTDSTATMSSDTTMMADSASAMPADTAVSYSDKSPYELLKLAEAGDAVAQDWLGYYYENGKGVIMDYQKALNWYRKSAEQGNANAQNNLGSMYEKGEGVTKDYQKAVDWYRKAAEQGNASAQYNLGISYYYGEGVKKNYLTAFTWLSKSAEQGDADAQSTLGVMYHDGNGVTQNYKTAYKWYKKAEEKGNAAAQYGLGVLYEDGHGVEKNLAEAKRLYRLSAKQGDTYAIKALKRLNTN